MVTRPQTKPKFRRCFVMGGPGQSTKTLIDLLLDRGIETTSAGHLTAGSAVTHEVLRLIAEADFVAAVLGPDNRNDTMFELGVARALAKPAFIVQTGGRLPFDFTGIYVRSVDGPTRIREAAEDLDIFLRNAKKPPSIETRAAETRGVELDWATAELERLRSGSVGSRGPMFEDFVGRVFKAAGAQVSSNTAVVRDVDLVVWLDELSYQTGGPVLVECKVLGGGTGSVAINAKAYVRRLEKALDATASNLALLIYLHQRPHTPPSIYETPQVLSFAIEDVLSGLRRGTFAREVLKRRERAAIARATDRA